MYYILNDRIGLRSWWLVPYAYYIRGQRNARGLKKEEFELLWQCDGSMDIPPSPLVERLVQQGFIRPCEQGEFTLSPWQRMNCENRYFPAMNWMITGKCNYNCLHCFNAADNAPLMAQFTLEEAEKLLDEAQQCGINAFTITGGEPMMHRDFFAIMEGIYRRGMFVEELNTNGFFIDQQALDRMKAIGCRPLIKISFDGLGHHDWMRNRKGAEENALRAIQLCKENGFRVKVQTNVHRRNVHAMLETARVMDGMGVDEMRIIRTTEVPRWNENAAGATLELTEYFDEMLKFAQAYIQEEHRMEVDVWQMMQIHPVQRCYSLRTVACKTGEYRDSLPVCRGNRGMVAITAGGEMMPCLQMTGTCEARGDRLGNVKQDGLQPHLRFGAYLNEVCTTVKALAEANPTCRDCKWFKHCCGGCRAIAYAFTGSTLGVDPSKCAFFNHGYYDQVVQAMGDWQNLTPMEA